MTTSQQEMKEYILKGFDDSIKYYSEVINKYSEEIASSNKENMKRAIKEIQSHRTEFLKLFEKESPQWTKKQDRLPAITEGFFDCLICGNDKRIMQSRFNCKTQRFQNMEFQDIHDSVISWTPLPESPIQYALRNPTAVMFVGK